MQKYILYLVLLMAVVGCKPDNAPVVVNTLKADTVFTQAKIKAYGKHYSKIDHAVFSLDLYSEGIVLDSTGHMTGNGTNLYFSDIFLPDSAKTLLDGAYKIDTTAACFTAIPGRNYEGGVTGTYLLLIQKSELKKIYYFESGTFSIHHDTDTTMQMTIHLETPDRQTYDAIYYGHS